MHDLAAVEALSLDALIAQFKAQNAKALPVTADRDKQKGRLAASGNTRRPAKDLRCG
jgi:hypothetical protein